MTLREFIKELREAVICLNYEELVVLAEEAVDRLEFLTKERELLLQERNTCDKILCGYAMNEYEFYD